MNREFSIKNIIHDYDEPNFEQLLDRLTDIDGELVKLKNARELEAQEENLARCETIKILQSEVSEFEKLLAQVSVTLDNMESLHASEELISKTNSFISEIKNKLKTRDTWIKSCFDDLPEELMELFPGLVQNHRIEDKHERDSAESDEDNQSIQTHFFNKPVLDELDSLKETINNMVKFIPMRPKEELFYQVSIWCGELRLYQENHRDDYEINKKIHEVFSILNKISKEHNPGRIIAFKKDYHCDWQQYLEKNRKDLICFLEEKKKQDDRSEIEKKREKLRISDGESKLQELKKSSENNASSDEFCQLAVAVYKLLGLDPRLLKLAQPRYDDLIGRECKPLRRALKKRIAGEQENDTDLDEYVDIQEEEYTFKVNSLRNFLPAQGRFCIIGGVKNNDLLIKLQRTLQANDIRWVEWDGGKTKGFDSLAKSIRECGIDAAIIITGNKPHNCADLNNALDSSGIPKYYVNNFSYVNIMVGIIKSLEEQAQRNTPS